MGVGDVIMIITLLVAILAIIRPNDRKHLLLKFSSKDWIICGFFFGLMHYFVFYDGFYYYGVFLDFLYFDNIGICNPKHYAYLATFFLLVFIVYKMLNSFFPCNKREKTIKYYKHLLENNEISYLCDLIEQYHLDDITSYLINDISKNNSINIVVWLCPFLKDNRYKYAINIFWEIIADEVFIKNTANIRPYFFAKIIAKCSKERRTKYPDDFVSKYIKEIFTLKNQYLLRELKNAGNNEYGQSNCFFWKNKILSAFLKDLSVSDVNEIWKPLKEIALQEIKVERSKREESELVKEFSYEDLLSYYSITHVINFYHFLMIESIKKGYDGTHFFLYVYNSITLELIENLEKVSSTDNKETNVHHLIKSMNDKLLHWLEICGDSVDVSRYCDICSCIGDQIGIMSTNQLYFSKELTSYFIERIFNLYCDLHDDRPNTNNIRKQIERILNKPNMIVGKGHPYYELIAEVWTKFDKSPHRAYGFSTSADLDYFTRLKEKVIEPLGLNVDLL